MWTLLFALPSLLACENLRARRAEAEALTADADADGWNVEEGDCDDEDPTRHPDATEVCNTTDDDCDGEIDEGTLNTWFPDLDGDGFGDPTGAAVSCEQPANYIAAEGDCDDLDADIHPQADERCDGVDNDCDGEIDQDVLGAWYVDADGDGYGDPGQPMGSCDDPEGYVDNDFDCDDSRPEVNDLARDVCDDLDNDCDGSVDEDPEIPWMADHDGDGFGDAEEIRFACDQPPQHVDIGGDCDPARPDVYPEAPEACDGLDRDCDGLVDEGEATGSLTWFFDGDGDGYGTEATVLLRCEDPGGDWTAQSGDCDDSSSGTSPAGTESCDGIDNNCDGVVDDSSVVDPSDFFLDTDGDGYGDKGFVKQACTVPSGYSALDTDCDDSRSDVNPGALEVCDSVDNDCDGDSDEAGAAGESTWYLDFDGDGHGDSASTSTGCDAPGGYVSDDKDCDDGNSSVSPSALEYCDSVDNDCDSSVDESGAEDTSTWYYDGDSDGYGLDGTTLEACDQPSGYAGEGGDCDDGDAAIYPEAEEVCDDGVDDDCDGAADDGCTEIHCGNITADETWAAGTPHEVTCNVSVQGGATLTIEDGAEVHFHSGTALDVGVSGSGDLEALGTTTGILMTAMSGTSAGTWDGVEFGSGASASVSAFEGVTVEYAGASSQGCLTVDGVDLSIDSVTLDTCNGGGLNVVSGSPSVSNSSFDNNSGNGVDWGSTASIGGWSNNSMSGNSGYPVSVSPSDWPALDATSSYTGNGTDLIRVESGTMDNTITVPAVDAELGGDIRIEGSTAPLVTIPTGTTIYMDTRARIYIGEGDYGDLDAQGVTFTSTATIPSAGDWRSLHFGAYTTTASTLDSSTVAYGGWDGMTSVGMVRCEDCTVDLTKVSFDHAQSFCLQASGSYTLTTTGATYGSCPSGNTSPSGL